MTDARWIEVDDDIASACRHFQNAASLYDEGGFDAPGLAGYKANMALLHAMQSAHRSLESGLTRILDILGEEPPVGDTSHADLIKRAARAVGSPGRGRPPILSQEIARDADESRRFRNRATHDYDNFEPALAVPSIEAARRLAAGLKACIFRFKAAMDPGTSGEA